MNSLVRHIASPRSGLLPLLFASALALEPASAQRNDLTPDQLAELRRQVDALQNGLAEKYAAMSQSASDVFLNASQSDKAALELYKQCVWKVQFEEEGKEASDFREWEDRQKERFRSDEFLQGLRYQLRWLAITCQANEAEDFGTVIPTLIAFIDSLMAIEGLPDGSMLGNATGSVFARAYEIENVLTKNDRWEHVPYNISGIYEKSILPYLRDENPAQLMIAWDKRITQQKAMVTFLEKQFEASIRGGSRDDKERKEAQAERRQRGNNILRAHDTEYFILNTLPELTWGKYVDMFNFVDQYQGASSMLAFIQTNIEHRRVEGWINQLAQMLQLEESPGATPDTRISTSVNPAGAANPDNPLGLE